MDPNNGNSNNNTPVWTVTKPNIHTPPPKELLKTTSKGKLAVKILLGLCLAAVIIVALLKIHVSKRKHVEIIITHEQQILSKHKNHTLTESKVHPKLRNKRQDVQQPWRNIRLPTNVLPKTYNVSLDVDMDNEVYTGIVDIFVSVTNDTRFILFHQSGLTLNTVTVTDARQVTKVIEYRRNEPVYEYHVVKMASKLKRGETYNLRISFNNTIRNDLNGFFISTHKTRKIAATFFSPINARTAFPCFDEPNFKAKFTLKITNSMKYSALSNMDVSSSTLHGNKKTTIFKESVRMSTYIFAWVIHDNTYQDVETKSQNGLVIKAWYFKEELKNIDIGINATVKLLEYYEDFFDSKFPLEKLDVTIQPYFTPSAMENWGLMTFRKSRYILQEHDAWNYVFGLSMIGHEMVHQWFGNLATMEYWNEAWLKEGFANYIGIYGVQQVDSNVPIGNLLYTTYMASALELDSFSTSHSLTPTLKTNSEIREMFDTITYNKGSCMVQMLQKYLGEETFKRGLRAFIKKYQYKNADQQGLWKVLGDTSGKDVKTFMKEWTEKKGYPLITVNRINATHVHIEQEQFLQDSPDHGKPIIKTIWQVLIVYKALDTSISGSYVLTGKKGIFKIPKNTILNPSHDLYYRVKYGPSMASDLKHTLKNNTKQMTDLDRIGLVSDQLNIMAAQQANLTELLEYLEYLNLGLEEANGAWDQVVRHFMMVYDILEDDVAKSKWRSFIEKHFIKPKINKYGLEACKLNILSYQNQKKKTGTSLSYAGGSILCCDIRADNSHLLWENKHKEFLNDNNENLLVALSCTNDVQRITRILSYSMDKKYVHVDTTTRLLGNIASTSDWARDATWIFVKSKWVELVARYNDDIYYLNELINGIIPLFSTEQQLKDVESFFNGKDLGTATNAVRQSISKIKMKISYKKYMTQQIKHTKKLMF